MRRVVRFQKPHGTDFFPCVPPIDGLNSESGLLPLPGQTLFLHPAHGRVCKPELSTGAPPGGDLSIILWAERGSRYKTNAAKLSDSHFGSRYKTTAAKLSDSHFGSRYKTNAAKLSNSHFGSKYKTWRTSLQELSAGVRF